MKRPRFRVCEKCYFITTCKHKYCPSCGNKHNQKENVMKWTKKTEQKMLAIISKHKKLQDGFIDAADKLNISKSAVTNRYYRVMKAKSNDALEPNKSIMIDKQKIGRATRNVDKKPLIIDMTNASLSDIERAKWALGNNFDQEAYQAGFDRVINPPISCDAGAVNYTNEPKIEKPKSFIEKVLAFFKGGKDE